MRRWSLAVILAVVVAAALATPLSAQKQGQIFVSLTSADGKPVEGLTADDISITEDGMACKTVKLEAISWPSKVQVLVDNGRSNTTPINPLRDGLKEFFMQIPDGVEMSMYVIAGTPRPIVKPTSDRQKLIDGIALIAPDSGAGMFFDALYEAADRVAKDKTPSFTTIVMVGSDIGAMRVLDREYQKLQETVFNKGVTTDVILTVTGQGTAGGDQVNLGITLTKLTGGRFENINNSSRLATLLPEYGKQVAEAVARQGHQYRVTYERPAKPNDRASIGATLRKEGVVHMSLHGNQ